MDSTVMRMPVELQTMFMILYVFYIAFFFIPFSLFILSFKGNYLPKQLL